MLKTNLKYLLLIMLFSLSCSQDKEKSNELATNQTSELSNEKWINSEVFFVAQNNDSSIEDVSIISYEGNYHLFYTSDNSNEKGINYTVASSLNRLNYSDRHHINTSDENTLSNPEIFYSEAQNKWYLFAYSNQAESVLYSTNNNINEFSNWSDWKKINFTEDIKEYFNIADNEFVYMFYTNKQGELFSKKSIANTFPSKFSSPQKVEFSSNNDFHIDGSLNINYLKSSKKFVAITDSNNEFTIFTSPSINGQWEKDNTSMVNISNIVNANGSVPYDLSIRNPLLIVGGNNNRIVKSDFNIIYQTKINSTNLGDKLRWGLSLITKQ